MADSKKGLTLADLVNQVGQNKIAINFVWTLVTGFLVMFMQAGFAIVETGLVPRQERQPHHDDELHGLRRRHAGLLADRILHPDGRRRRVANLGGTPPLSMPSRRSTCSASRSASSASTACFLTQAGTYDVGVMVLFLFQMVFMDTALTIVTGAAAERWKYAAFMVSSFMMGAFTYPLFANWAWGGGWLANLGANFGLGKGYCDFAGSGVVHAVGGITALAVSMIIGPRIGKYNRDGKTQRDDRSRYRDRADGLLHPGVRLVRV